jgi:uncharacterized protein (TIGR02284 family)
MADDHGLTHDATTHRAVTDAHDVRVLGDLQAAISDSAATLETAAHDSDGEARMRLFATLAEERARTARDLRATIMALGGSAVDTDGGSILAKARRAVADIGHALLGDEAGKAVGAVDLADDGETALIRRLDAALDDPELSDVARAAVRRARAAVAGDHEDLHALRQSLDSRRDIGSPLFPY